MMVWWRRERQMIAPADRTDRFSTRGAPTITTSRAFDALLKEGNWLRRFAVCLMPRWSGWLALYDVHLIHLHICLPLAIASASNTKQA